MEKKTEFVRVGRKDFIMANSRFSGTFRSDCSTGGAFWFFMVIFNETEYRMASTGFSGSFRSDCSKGGTFWYLRG